ncbi:Chl1p [Sugiyamaella lignohabitans]|uniref:ATP-dependent DNA helicase CHL1 n=1 Tax=Sugiyamaella lignohabitans TaxID=796027 RepID=A0A167ENN5_9ASCO|nr:Chl1p [Sugiyamaella lignohabitans]ANB14288.1 Chl1p [Sugiyamaella lignohabitans]
MTGRRGRGSLGQVQTSSVLTRPAQSESDSPEWVKKRVMEMKIKEQNERIEKFETYLARIRKIEEQEYEAHVKNKDKNHYLKKRKPESKNSVKQSDDDFLLDDYDSDTESSFPPYDSESGMSKEVQNLLTALSGPSTEDSIATELAEFNKVKIYFTSRTHSQLSQFASQLQLPKFSPSMAGSSDPKKCSESESTKVVPLGSRKQLCVNPKVNKYKNSVGSQINDACMDLQKESGGGCAWLRREHNPEDRVLLNKFRDRTLAKIRDIEDLADLGKELEVCPYYGSRHVVANTEIVTLPYQLLLQKSSRDALGIDLEDSIVVIDEAHNLLDTISSLNSMAVSVTEVRMAHKGLQIYWKKFAKKLNSRNRVYLSHTMKIVGALEKFMIECEKKPPKEVALGTEVNPAKIFDESSTADLINTYKLEKYLRQSKLAFKVDGYLEKLQDDLEDKNKEKSATKITQPGTVSTVKVPAKPLKRLPKLLLSKVISFLQAITNISSEGKVFYSRVAQSKEFQLQYLLLDPSEQFKEVVSAARCVILAGGTMEPTRDYLDYLFPLIPRSEIELFSCGHVIPDRNLIVSTMTQHGNVEFNFSFANRSSVPMIDELGSAILNLTKTVPHGMIVFFPSYQYLSNLVERWKATNLYSQLNSSKKIFLEPNDSQSIESMLGEYSQAIDNSPSGALLFSVVGGKMSEGINFSDDLARMVVMIGLPFPNAFSAEIIAKRDFIEKTALSSGKSLQQARDLSREYYENLCMRAVNQCIGRAIRHANDYAAMVLIDTRYNSQRIQSKLPTWIRARLSPSTQNTQTKESTLRLHSELSTFFSSHSKH